MTDSTRHAPLALTTAITRAAPTLIPALPDWGKRMMGGGSRVVIDGNELDPALQAFLGGQRRLGLPGLVVDDDIARTRSLTRMSTLALGGERAEVDTADLQIPGPAGPIGARHYAPPEPATDLLVYYHGGGFVFGDLDGFDPFCRLLCRDGGTHVLSVDYRLAPEHKAPAALDDALAAYRWALKNAGDLGAQPGRVAVGGDSAGGDLAAVVSRLARDAGDARPILQLLLYPITEFDAPTRSRTLFAEGFLLTGHDIEFFNAQYLQGSGIAADDPRISPLLADDLSGLPPALVVTAGFDPLRDEGNRYAKALAAAGVAVDLRQMDSMIHAFANLAGLGGGVTAAIAELTSALRAHLRSG